MYGNAHNSIYYMALQQNAETAERIQTAARKSSPGYDSRKDAIAAMQKSAEEAKSYIDAIDKNDKLQPQTRTEEQQRIYDEAKKQYDQAQASIALMQESMAIEYANKAEQAGASLWSARSRAIMPTRRALTGLGRAVNASVARRMQSQEAYIGATAQYDIMSRQYEQAVANGNYELAASLQQQMLSA